MNLYEFDPIRTLSTKECVFYSYLFIIIYNCVFLISILINGNYNLNTINSSFSRGKEILFALYLTILAPMFLIICKITIREVIYLAKLDLIQTNLYID